MSSGSPSTGETLHSAPLAWWPLLGIVGGSLLVCLYAFVISYFCSREDQGLVVDDIADDDFVDPPPFEAPVKAPKEDQPLEVKPPKPLKEVEEEEEEVKKEKKVSIVEKESVVNGSVVPPSSKLSVVAENKPALTALEEEPCIDENGEAHSVHAPTPVEEPLGRVTEETEVEVNPNDPWAIRPGPPAHVGQPVYLQPPSSRYGNLYDHPIYGGPGTLAGRPGARPVVDYSEELDALYGVVNTGRPVLSGRTYHTQVPNANSQPSGVGASSEPGPWSTGTGAPSYSRSRGAAR